MDITPSGVQNISRLNVVVIQLNSMDLFIVGTKSYHCLHYYLTISKIPNLMIEPHGLFFNLNHANISYPRFIYKIAKYLYSIDFSEYGKTDIYIDTLQSSYVYVHSLE